jgi:hypothetical protein
MEEDYMSGLLPTLYSEDPQASTAALLANPARARKDLENLQRVFFMPETISLVEAVRVVKKPRTQRRNSPTSFKTWKGCLSHTSL